MSNAFAAFKSGFGFGEKKQKKLLPAQFPKTAPLSDHRIYYEKYIEDGFAQDFLKEKGMKVPSAYKADSFLNYLELRGIPIGKAYGGKIQPRKAGRGSETR
tara:strand:+ start:799 stop:1101 length:303 start_codon:yes stop_codon:yes gene_type:complete